MKNRDNEHGQGAMLADAFVSNNDGVVVKPNNQTGERSNNGWSESEIWELNLGCGCWDGWYELDNPLTISESGIDGGDD